MTPQMFYQVPVHRLLQVTPPVFLRKGQTWRQWEDECGSPVLSYSCAVLGYRVCTQQPQQPSSSLWKSAICPRQPSEQSRAKEP